MLSLKLKRQDLGIYLVCRDDVGNFYAIQAKYRKRSRDKKIIFQSHYYLIQPPHLTRLGNAGIPGEGLVSVVISPPEMTSVESMNHQRTCGSSQAVPRSTRGAFPDFSPRFSGENEIQSSMSWSGSRSTHRPMSGTFGAARKSGRTPPMLSARNSYGLYCAVCAQGPPISAHSDSALF